jgi:hypothetical protein
MNKAYFLILFFISRDCRRNNFPLQVILSLYFVNLLSFLSFQKGFDFSKLFQPFDFEVTPSTNAQLLYSKMVGKVEEGVGLWGKKVSDCRRIEDRHNWAQKKHKILSVKIWATFCGDARGIEWTILGWCGTVELRESTFNFNYVHKIDCADNNTEKKVDI